MPIVIHEDDDGSLYKEDRVHSWETWRKCVLDDPSLWAEYELAAQALAKARDRVLAALRLARPDEVHRG